MKPSKTATESSAEQTFRKDGSLLGFVYLDPEEFDYAITHPPKSLPYTLADIEHQINMLLNDGLSGEDVFDVLTKRNPHEWNVILNRTIVEAIKQRKQT